MYLSAQNNSRNKYHLPQGIKLSPYETIPTPSFLSSNGRYNLKNLNIQTFSSQYLLLNSDSLNPVNRKEPQIICKRLDDEPIKINKEGGHKSKKIQNIEGR